MDDWRIAQRKFSKRKGSTSESKEGRQTGEWMDESVLLLFGYAMIELTSVFCNDGDRLIDKNPIPVEANNRWMD